MEKEPQKKLTKKETESKNKAKSEKENKTKSTTQKKTVKQEVVKEQSNKKKIIIGSIVAIILIVIIAMIVIFSKKEEEFTGLIDLNQTENVKIEGNQKINTSKELKQEKQIENLIVKDIQLKTEANMTNLIATVENKSTEVFKGREIEMIFKTQDGEEIATVKGYIDTVEPEKTTILNTYTMADIANAYDFEIK